MSIARRMLTAVATAIARKLAATESPRTALALGSGAQLAPIAERRSGDCLPIDRPAQTLIVPPNTLDRSELFYRAGQGVFRQMVNAPPMVAPAPPPRRHRKVVTETITFEESEW